MAKSTIVCDNNIPTSNDLFNPCVMYTHVPSIPDTHCTAVDPMNCVNLTNMLQ